jgi:hypothetical protein
MTQIWGTFGQRTLALVGLVAFTGLGLSSGGVMEQNSKTAEDELKVFDRNNFDRSANTGLALAGGALAGEIKDKPRFTQGSDFSSLKDWHLKAENLLPHGVNPLYYPIVPGHKHVHERPDHPDGYYRKETVVLDDTEDFDIPGIGKFKAGVVQEEEYLDGVLHQRSLNWVALDKTTNSVYALGEVSWEINEEGKPVFGGTWRAGDPDGHGIAEPGLLMPGTFKIGDRYIFDGSHSAAYGGSENMEFFWCRPPPRASIRAN